MDVLRDQDPVETLEWREALRSVLAFEGPQRVYHILGELMDEAQRQGAPIPFSATTPYLNTIAPAQEAPHPGNRDIERPRRGCDEGAVRRDDASPDRLRNRRP